MRLIKSFVYCGSTALLFVAGCATVVPRELVDARAAYNHAATGPAATADPADLHKAREALATAEQAFANAPTAQNTRDLAYVAERRAELAEALASQMVDTSKKSQADQEFIKDQTQIQANTKGQLTQTREQLAESQRQGDQKSAQLTQEQQARMTAEAQAADAEQRAKAAQDALTKLAAVKEEERGLVITLSGSVLFTSDGAELLPDAQTRLNQVADALLATKERSIVVEGHTDSRGSEAHNLDLSQRRAESVRAYLISRGYQADLITARGIGKGRPIADNSSAEGRANNRRVEIVVQPKRG